MRQITLYLTTPSLTFLFTTTSENSPLLFNGNKINREVLEKKKKEIFGLPTARAIDKIPTLEQYLFNYKNAKLPSDKGY